MHEFAPQVEDTGAAEQSGLREYAQLLWRKKVTVLLVAALAVGGMLAYCFIPPKTYTASTTMLLEPPVSQTLLDVGAPSSLAGIINVSDKIQEIESGAVAQLAAQAIPNAPGVTATEVGTNTDVVTLSVSSGDPHLAAAAANAYAAAYIKYERNLTNQTFSSATKQIQNKVDTVQLAITNVQNQIKGAAPGSSLALEEGQLGQLQNEFDGLQNQLQTVPVLCHAGHQHRGRPGDLRRHGADETLLAQDDRVHGPRVDLRAHRRHRPGTAGQRHQRPRN